MTTLVTAAKPGGSIAQRRVESSPDGTRALLGRLLEESSRQVPFSQAKLLLREAAAVIERLEGELGRVEADLATERAARLR